MVEWLDESYKKYLIIFWSNLSRLNNLFIILNISMFFLSGLVSRGYTYTFYSVSCFLIVAIVTILPVGFVGRLWFYLLNLFIEFVGIYFFIASIAYWVETSAQLGG
jgi:hypothetical protein